MKAVALIIKGNMSHRKLYSIIILVFSFFTSLLLITSLGIIEKLHSQYPESYNLASESDMVYIFDQKVFNKEIETSLDQQENINKTNTQTGFMGEIDISGDKSQLILTGLNVDKNYVIQDTQNNFSKKLKGNEVLLPLSYRDSYDLSTGSDIEIFDKTFSVAGFFEDPIFGSPFFEIKRLFISDEVISDFKNSNEISLFKKVVFLEGNVDSSDKRKAETIQNINEHFLYSKDALIYFNKVDLSTFRTTAPTIIMGIVVLFSLFLLVIMIFVLRYILTSVIEQEIKPMGTLKAIGFKGSQILTIFSLQYLMISLVGIIFGAFLSYLIAPSIGGFMLNVSGIIWEGNIFWGVTALIAIGLLLFIFLIITASTWQVFRVKPVDAIVERNVARSRLRIKISFFKFPLKRLGIGEKISINQLLFSLGQYISLLILLVLFSFSIMNLVGISKAFSTVENVSHMLGYDVNDIKLDVVNQKTTDVDELISEIDSSYDVTYQTMFDSSRRVQIDDNPTDIQLLVYSYFPENNIIKGRAPAHEDEVIVSGGISKDYDKSIGDQITLGMKEGESKVYQIVGIYNQVYDMGKNIGLTDEGAKLLVPSFEASQYLLKIKNSSKIDELIEKFDSNHQGINFSNERKFVLTRIETIQTVLNIISILVIVISLVLISLIIFLLSLVLINRETYNLGILKSLGFTSIQLRLQFVIRFLIIGVIGAILGMIFYWLSDNILINSIFNRINISPIPSDHSMTLILFNICYILALVVGNTFIVSNKIKKVNVKMLVTEI